MLQDKINASIYELSPRNYFIVKNCTKIQLITIIFQEMPLVLLKYQQKTNLKFIIR